MRRLKIYLPLILLFAVIATLNSCQDAKLKRDKKVGPIANFDFDTLSYENVVVSVDKDGNVIENSDVSKKSR